MQKSVFKMANKVFWQTVAVGEEKNLKPLSSLKIHNYGVILKDQDAILNR